MSAHLSGRAAPSHDSAPMRPGSIRCESQFIEYWCHFRGARMSFQACIPVILSSEDGYVNNPRDPGWFGGRWWLRRSTNDRSRRSRTFPFALAIGRNVPESAFRVRAETDQRTAASGRNQDRAHSEREGAKLADCSGRVEAPAETPACVLSRPHGKRHEIDGASGSFRLARRRRHGVWQRGRDGVPGQRTDTAIAPNDGPRVRILASTATPPHGQSATSLGSNRKLCHSVTTSEAMLNLQWPPGEVAHTARGSMRWAGHDVPEDDRRRDGQRRVSLGTMRPAFPNDRHS